MTSNAINGGMLVPEPAMVQMFPTGAYLDLLDPKPQAIHATDIAHHTSLIVRYNGGVRRFYSVAEHASLVSDLLAWQGQPTDIVLAGLLHDAGEAYLGDMVSPAKYAMRVLEAKARGLSGEEKDDNGAWFTKPPRDMRGVFSELGDPLDEAIGQRFGLDPETFEDDRVKTADMWALKIEAEELTVHRGSGWRWPGELPAGGKLPIAVRWHAGLQPDEAEREWLTRLGLLLAQRRREDERGDGVERSVLFGGALMHRGSRR